MIYGKHTGLRALEFQDLSLLQVWRNNPLLRRYYREYRELTCVDQENWYNNICCNNRNFCMFGIVALDEYPEAKQDHTDTHEIANASEGKLIGVCGLTNINWVIRSAELSFYIGWNNLYVDSLYAPDAVKTLCMYAFKTLNMHRVWAEIYEFDLPKVNLFAQLNMVRDGVLRDTAFEDGSYHNSLIYSMLDSEFLV